MYYYYYVVPAIRRRFSQSHQFVCLYNCLQNYGKRLQLIMKLPA